MSLAPAGTGPLPPPMVTLQILGGRKWKICPGDVLGALAKDLGFAGAMVGKISVNEFSTHVAVDRQFARDAPRRAAKPPKSGGQRLFRHARHAETPSDAWVKRRPTDPGQQLVGSGSQNVSKDVPLAVP